jgi:hypothetical protein
MRKTLALSLAILALLVAAGCARAAAPKVAVKGYVNHTLFAPMGASFDELMARIPKSDMGIEQARAKAPGFLTRPAMNPVSILDEGKGFDLLFGDKIELSVVSSPDPLAVKFWLDLRVATNTAGIYSATTVRGVPAVASERGTQAYPYGAVNNYPADLMWSQKTTKGYLVYTLRGDVPVASLKEIANGLR